MRASLEFVVLAVIGAGVVLAGAPVAHAQPAGRVVGTVAVTEADGARARGAEVIVYGRSRARGCERA